MSDTIQHECGVAFIRLLKPINYYIQKYGTWSYGLQRLYLLMEKQHNRGQDAAGVASVKINPVLGRPYIDRFKSNSKSSLTDVFDHINNKIAPFAGVYDPLFIKENIPFAGDIYLGHLRYAIQGDRSMENAHPVMRFSNWKSQNLVLAGNFNLTNTDEIFNNLVDGGQHPRNMSGTVTILEKIGFFLDKECDRLTNEYSKTESNKKIVSASVDENIDIAQVLRNATKHFDGGYTIGGILGNGDSFVLRDPNGIRPAFYFANDEFVVAASERPVIQTAFKVDVDEVKEISPGNALIVKHDGTVREEEIRKPAKRTACSFERIYFSRGTDKYIYEERKKLGEQLIPDILRAIDGDIVNTVFSYIPNTAETAFYGMTKGIDDYVLHKKHTQIMNSGKLLSSEEMWDIINARPRVEKIAVKDVKMRTFITEDKARNDMVEHVYDVSYGIVRPGKDNLVIIDDSIVRGTTLKTSILRMLDRLKPKKIIIVSSAPQIRYPDCYGIDMSSMNEFCAFRATIKLIEDTGQQNIITEVYRKCKNQQNLPKEKVINYVKELYAPFTDEQIARKITEILLPDDMKTPTELVFQTLEGLHKACPTDNGDWYFSGNYPTPGGDRAVNNAFINFYEKQYKT